MGLSRVPPVLLVPARIPPMLWPHRAGPRLLLPEGLLPDLGGDELDTLLAHELAHVRRRDHWVRLVEIAATALFWWYPVTWWARRALRRAEERCCDEWVLRLLPRSAEAYANGLLKSLTFVTGTPSALPSLASGVGPVEDIEARLKEILMTRPVPRLAAPIRLTLAAAAVLGLAVFPTHAQSSVTKDEPAAPAAATPTAAAPSPLPSLPSHGRRWRRVPPSLRLRPSHRSRPLRPWPRHTASRPGSRGRPRPDAAGAAGPGPRDVVAPPRTSDSARRALEDQRRAIEDQRRQLQQQELELQGKQLELEARDEQAELRATADRLRAEGHADEAPRIDKQVELTARRMELQSRQLGVEAERVALEAKARRRSPAPGPDRGSRGGRARGRGRRRPACDGAADAERQQAEQASWKRSSRRSRPRWRRPRSRCRCSRSRSRSARCSDSTDELAPSLTEQIQSLKEAVAEAPSQKAAVDREIQRLEAALAALLSGGTPKSSARRTPRAQP